jgi:mannose-6-phosphate isomerase-like protein (cupin superfamily)
MMDVINLTHKFGLFNDHWSPKIVGEMNGQQIKLAKVKGEFVWHDHKDEDELFFVVKGKLKIEFRDKTVELNEGEMLIVPKGVEHKPMAEEEVLLMLIEPKNTKHTGDVKHELTVEKYDTI